MQRLVGIFRTGADLEEALRQLKVLIDRWKKVRVEGSPAYNPGWNLYFELGNMLVCSRGGRAQRPPAHGEPRGPCRGSTIPALDAEWGTRNSTVALDGEKMRVTAEPLPQMPDDLRKLIKS